MAWAVANAGMLTLSMDKDSGVAQGMAPDKLKLDQCREERLEAVLSVEVCEEVGTVGE